jgi:type IV secretion system protein VirB10
MGVGIGAAAGAAAGLVGVLASRGPEAVLARGSTLEMVLDRPLSFDEAELDFSGPGLGSSNRRLQPPPPAQTQQQQQGLPLPGRGIPGRRTPQP